MTNNDPTTWPLTTWLLALGMAMAGGVINWLARIKKGRTRPFNIIELLGEVFTSGFIGLGAFMIVNSLGEPLGLCAAAAGVAGHMATRLLYLLERIIENRINSLDL